MSNREKAEQYRRKLEAMSKPQLAAEFDRAMEYIRENNGTVRKKPDVYKRINSSSIIFLG